MSYSPNQPRDRDGKFAGSGHTEEAETRDAGRYPVAPHEGQRAPGSHTGTRYLDARTMTPEEIAAFRRQAALDQAERDRRKEPLSEPTPEQRQAARDVAAAVRAAKHGSSK